MIDLTLMAIVDSSSLSLTELPMKIESVARGGATCLQIRAKRVATAHWIRYVRRAGEASRRAGLPFLVNDRVDLALESKADGVHLGQDDLPVDVAREQLGKRAVIGATAHTLEAAVRAERAGADYIGVGPLFATPTKPKLAPIDRGVFGAIREAISIPLVGIGGVDASRAAEAAQLGLDGVAVISALWRVDRPDEEASEIVRRFREGRG